MALVHEGGGLSGSYVTSLVLGYYKNLNFKSKNTRGRHAANRSAKNIGMFLVLYVNRVYSYNRTVGTNLYNNS